MALTAVPEKPNLCSNVEMERPMKPLTHMLMPMIARHAVIRKKMGLEKEDECVHEHRNSNSISYKHSVVILDQIKILVNVSQLK